MPKNKGKKKASYNGQNQPKVNGKIHANGSEKKIEVAPAPAVLAKNTEANKVNFMNHNNNNEEKLREVVASLVDAQQINGNPTAKNDPKPEANGKKAIEKRKEDVTPPKQLKLEGKIKIEAKAESNVKETQNLGKLSKANKQSKDSSTKAEPEEKAKEEEKLKEEELKAKVVEEEKPKEIEEEETLLVPMGKVSPDCLELVPFSIKILSPGIDLLYWPDLEENRKWNRWAYPYSDIKSKNPFLSYDIKNKAFDEKHTEYHFISETKHISSLIKMANGSDAPSGFLMLKEGNSIMIDEMKLLDICNLLPCDPIIFKYLKEAIEKEIVIKPYTYSREWVLRTEDTKSSGNLSPFQINEVIARSMTKNLPGFRDSAKEPVDAISKTAEMYLLKKHSGLFLYDITWKLGDHSMFLSSRTPICSLDKNRLVTMKFKSTSRDETLDEEEAIDMFFDNCFNNVKETLLYHHTDFTIDKHEFVSSKEILKRASLDHNELFENGEKLFNDLKNILKKGVVYYVHKRAGSEEIRMLNLNELWSDDSKASVEKCPFPGKISFEIEKEVELEKEKGDGDATESEVENKEPLLPPKPQLKKKTYSQSVKSNIDETPEDPKRFTDGLEDIITVSSSPLKLPFESTTTSTTGVNGNRQKPKKQ